MSNNYYSMYFVYLSNYPKANVLKVAQGFVDDSCGGSCCKGVEEFEALIASHWVGESDAT